MRNINFSSYLILKSKVFTRACAGIHLVRYTIKNSDHLQKI